MRLFQAFYWDCPEKENKAGKWWEHVRGEVPRLAKAGFTGLWLPPSAKAGHVDSMGYAPYDYYDQGEFDQKGGVATWFGTKAELTALIGAAHDNGMAVIGDAVLNHCDLGDEDQKNPFTGEVRKIVYKPASGKFPRDWSNFHPCDYNLRDSGAFYGATEGYDLPDLCHDNPDTYAKVMAYIGWLRSVIGYDGFRYDAVKYFDSWIVQSIQEWQRKFGVVEYWDGDTGALRGYLDKVAWSASAFDFPLFYALRDMCQDPGYDLRRLWGSGFLFQAPMHAVTFASNHDVERSQPIATDKLLAYAFLFTHEGVPCVFWMDYYNFALALENTPNGIAALCGVHRDFAGGTTRLLHADERLYIAERAGFDRKPGLVFVLNTAEEGWRGATVQTGWRNHTLRCAAWWGHDMAEPRPQRVNGGGWGEFYAPPRGYAVYVP